MHAGLDLGTTLSKAVWRQNDSYRFASTADCTIEDLIGQLKAAQVNTINLAGIGYLTADLAPLGDFDLRQVPGESIGVEKKLQAQGVKHLLQPFPMWNYFLVSIGTGTSYSACRFGLTIPIPLGSALGGGFLCGIGRALGVSDPAEITARAQHGQCLDLYIQDKIPATKGTALGQFVIAHYGIAKTAAPIEDILTTAVHTVAASVVRDIAILGAASFVLRGISDVIYIGTSVSKNKLLRTCLDHYTKLIGKRPHFFGDGEYALAMGAYHAKNTQLLSAAKVPLPIVI